MLLFAGASSRGLGILVLERLDFHGSSLLHHIHAPQAQEGIDNRLVGYSCIALLARAPPCLMCVNCVSAETLVFLWSPSVDLLPLVLVALDCCFVVFAFLCNALLLLPLDCFLASRLSKFLSSLLLDEPTKEAVYMLDYTLGWILEDWTPFCCECFGHEPLE